MASIAGGIGLVFGIAVVVYLLSADMKGPGQGMLDRLQRLVPFQSFKIIIVVWQIVTQVSMAGRRNLGGG